MPEEMSSPLLTTKFHIPPSRPNLVSRLRLVDRLNSGLENGHSLTLISAPAGFGKTTLLAEWIDSLRGEDTARIKNGASVAWLSLDESDSDPTHFLTYFVATLNKAEGLEAPVGTGALSMLKAPEPPPTEPILTSIINDISVISRIIILVLDDYHLIDSSSGAISTTVDDALAFMLDHLPPQLHLVVATRVDPNLPVARLRARGQLSELRAADLRFTFSETAAFLNRVMGLSLSTEDIAALETRTEGWIAGLQLAALALQGTRVRQGPVVQPVQNDTARLIESFRGSHRYVLDYLVEEVLERQSESVQRFLLHTAILDRFTGDLCDAVRFADGEAPNSSETTNRGGNSTSQAILEMLEHANLFIISLDEERLWYRYHHLFADLLRRRLRQTQPEIVSNLHARAGAWFKRQGLRREAIKHSLAATDYAYAAELIRSVAINIVQEGEHTTVIGWIASLPEDLVKEQPYLCVLDAWALQLAGQLDAAEARLVDAENAMNEGQQSDEDEDTILGLIHSHRAYMTFMTGEHDKTISYARMALEQLPETAALIRAQTALYLGVTYRYQGQFQSALTIYNEILPTAQRIGGKLSVLAHLHLGDLNRQMAHLYQAHQFYQEALLLTERETGRPEMPYTGYAYVCIGRILRQWNQLEDSNRFTMKGLALCRDWNVADILALSCIEMAHISQALADDEQARASMEEAIQIMDSFSPWGSRYAAAHQAKMDLVRGDMNAAERWEEANDLILDGDFEFHREGEYLALARVLIFQRHFGEAHALAERIRRIARRIGKKRTELEALVLLALISSEQDETDQALIYLESALAIAEPEGFIRIFVDEGPPMARLLTIAFRQRLATEYVRRLLAAFSVDQPVPDALVTMQTEQSQLVEPLSERELEVLHHIAEGLANREVAARLYLSLNTVKAHTRNIYGKLDVHSRTQAVARARDLGLLPDWPAE